MPFGLINVGATFQRAMDIAFRGLINYPVVVYLGDVTVFSKYRHNHIVHLGKLFEHCRKHGVSLNPKKTICVVTQSLLLGCVVSKHQIMIDLELAQSISKITFPSSKKSMQSFLGKINFVRRYIPSFSEIIRPLQNMIKKDVVFNWGNLEKESSNQILESIAEAPGLLSPDFSKDFILYTFASYLPYVAVLTEHNQQNYKVSIFFYDFSL